MFEYLFFDFSGEQAFNILNNNSLCPNLKSLGEIVEPCLMWGITANIYQVDEKIVSMMGLIGLVGTLGIICGSIISKLKYENVFLDISRLKYSDLDTMSLFAFFIWVSVAYISAYLTAPSGSIFSDGYINLNRSFVDSLNFSALIFVSFVLFIFAFCDFKVEKDFNKKIIKGTLLFISIFIVIIYLQLLKGDRESITLLISIIILYFLVTKNKTKKINFRLLIKSIIIVLLILSVSAFIGRFRGGEISNSDNIIAKANETIKYSGQGSSMYSFIASNLQNSTWSASLLSVLSVSGDYLIGSTRKALWTKSGSNFEEHPFKFYIGKTYLQYLLSLPPGFVADWIGYQRPIDGYSGPTWEMRYGLGGVHGYVVPFINFSLYGVFIFAFLTSYFINHIYYVAYKIPNVKNLAFVGTVICVAPHWMWYGDKYAINILIISYISLWLYKIALKVKLIGSS